MASQPEQPRTLEKSVEELYFDALEKKSETLIAFDKMNFFRSGKGPEEMTSEEIEQYKRLRENWRIKKESSFSAFEKLPEDKQLELAAMGSRLFEVLVKLEILNAKRTPKPETAGENISDASVSETGGSADTEAPENALSLADVEDKIRRIENSSPVPLLELEAWKAKRAELQERRDAEANPDRTPPKGFMQRVKDSYNKAKESFVWANAIMRKEAMESIPEQQEQIQQQTTEDGTETQEVTPKKDTFWTLGFWKERVKGLLTPFGFLEFYRAEKFRRRTGEVANDTEALATSIQKEKSLEPEEAEKEAWEIVDTLKKQGLTISALEFYNVSKNITDRKRKENDEQIAYVVKSAEDNIYDKLQKSGHKGEAGQELLTRENQLAIRSELMAILNKLRDGAVQVDQKELVKLMRRNLDDKWSWRYVYGGIDAALWFAGIAAISVKFLASKEAVAIGSKAVAGGAGSAEAAREFVETGMHKNIWSTLEQMAKNGPGHIAPTGEQLKEWSQGVLDSIKHYEPEWVDHAVEGLKSSRTMPEGFPFKVPGWVMKVMGYPGF